MVHTMGCRATVVLVAMEVHHAGCCEATEATLGTALRIWSNDGAGCVRLQAPGWVRKCAGEVSRLMCWSTRAVLTMKLPIGPGIRIAET